MDTNAATAAVADRSSVVFDHVTKQFGWFRALDDITFSVEKGTVFGVVGTSGAGKSTLIRTVNGLERPTSGEVQVLGSNVGRLSKGQLRRLRRDVSMVFQHYNLLSTKTVAENVAMPLVLAKASRKSIDEQVHKALDLVGLAERADHRPAQLSGGQRQRVGIARALVTNPKVLLCDEPTSALDPITNNQILDLLSNINRELGITILIITHQMEVVARLADNVAVLEQGKLIESGSVSDVFTHPQQDLTKRFVASVSGRELPSNVDISGYDQVLRLTSPNPPTGLLRAINDQCGILPDLLHADSMELRNSAVNTLIIGTVNQPQLADWLRDRTHVEVLHDRTV